MPTILVVDGTRVVIYPNDRRPPHVHVIKAEKYAVVLLNCPEGPPELFENDGFSRRDLVVILGAVADRLTEICTRWEEIHHGRMY